MSLAIALLAAAVLAWPMPHPAPLAWPQPPGSAAPSATVRGRWSGRGRLSRRRRAAQDAADLLAVVEGVLPALEAGGRLCRPWGGGGRRGRRWGWRGGWPRPAAGRARRRCW